MIIIDQEVKVIYPRTIEQAVCELQLTEIAGRNCWRSEGKMDDESYKKFIENLRKRGHESPLEFSHIMYQLDTSRDVMAELTRHRIGVAFAIESQRYVNESAGEGGIKFIKPLFYKEFDPYYNYAACNDKVYEASRAWDDAMSLAEDEYNRLIAGGMKNEDARKVLPNSTATRIMMKVNLRELLHIYGLRSSKAAYPEMRRLMELLKIETDKIMPGFLPEKE